MAEKTMRFGIVGPGSIARVHSLAIGQAENAELVAVYGRDEAKTREFSEQHGIRAYSDLEAFLDNPDIDAVAIATVSGTHLDIGIRAARAGKHIICEKPLEVTPERAAELIGACHENRVTLAVFFQARFDPCTQRAKAAIAAGRLGRILFASCQMRWYRNQDYYDSAAWRGTWALDGGGCLMNQGIHTIDLLVHLVGQPVEVSTFQGPVTHERIEVEDNLCASVRFACGAVGTIEASTSCAPGFPRRIDISGEKGSIVIEGDRIVRWEFVDKQPEDVDVIAAEEVDAGGAADPTAIDITGHRLAVEDFVRSIREKRSPFIDGREGKKAVDFVCAIYDSMRIGKPVSLG